jgi:hypothetical protein
MPDYEGVLSALEESLRHFSPNCKFQKTGSPNIICTTLPPHWRSNKSLPTPFVVILLSPVPDGTKVTVTAGNEENDTADVKNHIAEVIKQVARFSDLRFVGKSGRGKNFNLTITIHHSNFREITVVPSVIKVTVDGPRDSRNVSKCHYSNNPYDYRKRPISMTPFDIPLNLGHSIPSTSGLFDLTNPSKRPRLNHVNNNNNNINPNPIISNGNEFFKPQQLSMSSIPLQPFIFPMAAAAMTQQQPFLEQHVYTTYLTLYAAALASSLNPPPLSDSASSEENIKNEKKISNLETSKSENSSPQEPSKTKEKKVWRPFISAE